MPVTTQSPVVTYTANGSVTSFAFPFRIVKQADLSVFANGVLVTSGYSITGVDVPAGGNVVFTVAPVGGTIVRLQRIITLERTTDYVEGGQLAANTLDADFDRVVMMIQDLNGISFKEGSDGAFSLNNRRISNVATPVVDTDAVTKIYVDQTIPANVASAAASAAASATSQGDAAASAASAAISAANAAAANLPTPIVGAAGKMIRVNAGETGYEFQTPVQVLSNIGAAASGHDHTGVYESANVNIAKINVTQSWSSPQRASITTSNTGSFDLSAGNNFTCTPTAAFTLTFTNLVAGQSGSVVVLNNSNYAASKASLVKGEAAFLSTVSNTGSYRISYFCDGTNVYVSTTGALS